MENFALKNYFNEKGDNAGCYLISKLVDQTADVVVAGFGP